MHKAFHNNSHITMEHVKQAQNRQLVSTLINKLASTCANISAYDNGSLSDIFCHVTYHTKFDQTNLLYMQL